MFNLIMNRARERERARIREAEYRNARRAELRAREIMAEDVRSNRSTGMRSNGRVVPDISTHNSPRSTRMQDMDDTYEESQVRNVNRVETFPQSANVGMSSGTGQLHVSHLSKKLYVFGGGTLWASKCEQQRHIKIVKRETTRCLSTLSSSCRKNG